MAAGISKTHGQMAAGAFYGMQPTVVRVLRANVFTADTGGGTSAIVEGGYSKAIRALQTVASVVWASAIATDDDYVCVVVDGGTFNTGAGATTAGTYGALKDALVSTVGGAAANYTIAVSSVLNSDGTFTFA